MASSEISHAPILSAATATASATAAAAATMSKSKKKRMQRAKAKQRKEEEQQPGNGSIGMSSIPANSLNPLDSIRSDLVKLGYELSYVDKAMDEMWTQQLDYSDMDSVLTFIQERDKRRSVDVLASASTVSATSTATATALDDLEEYSTVPTTDSGLVQDGKIAEDSGSPTPTENSSSRSTHRSTPNGNGNGNASPTPCAVPLITTASTDADADAEAQEYPLKHTSISTTQDPTATGTKLKKQTKGEQPLTQPLSLSAKLDIVAQSQDLTDGIIALTEWVVKAATPPQIMELCECNDSNTNKNSNTNNNADANALKTVIKRIILSGDRKYTGQLLDLIGTILRTVGAPSTQLVSSAKALGMLLKRTSEACADNTTDQLKGAIANSVSEHAAKIVASVVKSMIQDSASVVHAYASKNVEADMHQLLQGASDKSKNSGKSVVDLMANRDKSKSVSEKYSVLVEVSIQEQESQADASKDADNASTAGAVATPLDESEVVKDMLGDNYHSVVTSKAKMMELKSREEQMNNSIPERVELLERRRLQNEEKERIGSRIQQLRAELLQLEQEEKEVMAKVEDSELKLEIMDGSFSEEAKQVREELEAVSQKVKVEACVSQVAQQLCEFDSAMKAVSNSQSQPKKADDDNDDGESSKGEEGDIASKVGNALNCYLRVTSFYFSSELNVLSFLTARATNIEAEIPTLEREIREFEALGMTSIVEDMRRKEKEMRSNLRDDNNVVRALKEEANQAKDRFVEQMERCLASSSFNKSQLDSYATILTQIDGILADIGISSDAKWTSLMIRCGCVFPHETNEKKAPLPSPSSTPTQSASAPSTSSGKPKVKKTGWNTAPLIKETKSLVEIQKSEEQQLDQSESRDFELELSQPTV